MIPPSTVDLGMNEPFLLALMVQRVEDVVISRSLGLLVLNIRWCNRLDKEVTNLWSLLPPVACFDQSYPDSKPHSIRSKDVRAASVGGGVTRSRSALLKRIVGLTSRLLSSCSLPVFSVASTSLYSFPPLMPGMQIHLAEVVQLVLTSPDCLLLNEQR